MLWRATGEFDVCYLALTLGSERRSKGAARRIGGSFFSVSTCGSATAGRCQCESTKRYLATQRTIGDRFLRLTTLPTFPLDRLSRYEQTLWRQARQILFALESLQHRKRAPVRSPFPFPLRRREPRV